MDLDTLENIMRRPEGRRFVLEVLDLCCVNQHYTTGNGREDIFANGRRSVGDEILRNIRRIESASESEDGLALEYTMRREHQRRMEELEHGRDDEY
jgi:histidinol-phosphate transaminase